MWSRFPGITATLVGGCSERSSPTTGASPVRRSTASRELREAELPQGRLRSGHVEHGVLPSTRRALHVDRRALLDLPAVRHVERHRCLYRMVGFVVHQDGEIGLLFRVDHVQFIAADLELELAGNAAVDHPRGA